VTGMGMITPIGLDVPSTWRAMQESRSGTGPITQFDASAFDVQVAAEVKGFDPESLMDRRSARRSGRHTQMAVVAANEAVASANSACASGGDAIGQAMNLLRLGYADCIIAGGAEAVIGRVMVASLGGIGALTHTWNAQPEKASRPFDAKRSGFVLGEGAGVL